MKFLAAIGIILLSLFAGAALYVSAVADRKIHIDGERLVYEVPRGANVTSIMSDLSRRGILTAPLTALRVYARATRFKGQIKAGEYALSGDMTASSVLRLFRSGKVIQRQITFVEGWTFRDWRNALRQQEALEQTLDSVSDSDIMELLGAKGVYPEGQFFPDTYHYTRGETDLSILARAHQRLEETLQREWDRGWHPSVLPTPYEALILASIVEKESGHAADRPKIARVFINRLAANMRLQSDPTIIYGLVGGKGSLGRPIMRREIEQPTPYNTYVIDGLPPGPIANPGRASLEAAARPARTKELFFVADGSGGHTFAETYEQHQKNVARLRAHERDADPHRVPNPAPVPKRSSRAR
jgi:UPF0755 protein